MSSRMLPPGVSELTAISSLVLSLHDFVIFVNIAAYGGLLLLLSDDLSIVLPASSIGIIIELDLSE